MQSQPFLKFSYEIDIHASPEVIFPYLVEPEKFTVWQSFKYLGQVSANARIEYKGKPDAGTKFTRYIDIDPIPGARTQATSTSQVMSGTISQFNPPFLLELATTGGNKGVFQTVTHDLYTLTNTAGGSKLRLDSKVCVKYEETEYVTNIILKLLQLFIIKIGYFSYLVFKKFLGILLYFQIKSAMKIPFKKLKQAVEESPQN